VFEGAGVTFSAEYTGMTAAFGWATSGAGTAPTGVVGTTVFEGDGAAFSVTYTGMIGATGSGEGFGWFDITAAATAASANVTPMPQIILDAIPGLLLACCAFARIAVLGLLSFVAVASGMMRPRWDVSKI
jgi:hypothetical protein